MSNNEISIAKNLQKNNSKKNNGQVSKKNNIRPKNLNKIVTKEQQNNSKQVVKKINNTNKAKIQQNKYKKLDKIRITPLGGVEEVAKNMYMVEIGDEIYVLDAGLMFPETEMIGIDAVIPDISYLVRNKQKIKGIFLSNGHVSSMGAVPYIIDKLKCPVYGSKLTIDLLKNHLKQLGIKRRIKFYYLKDNNKYQAVDKCKICMSQQPIFNEKKC